MSDAVKRYTVTMDFNGGSPGLEDESGEFVYAHDDADELGRKGYGKSWQVVLATDYDALVAENARVTAERDIWRQYCRDVVMREPEITLRAALAALDRRGEA